MPRQIGVTRGSWTFERGLWMPNLPAAPRVPRKGMVRLYVDSTGGLHVLKPDGTNTTLGAGGGGSVATDSIFDAKGDLAVGTGADAAAKLTVGANDTVPVADSSQSVGLRYSYAQLWDTIITKTADEDVSSNTTPQDDNELLWSGTVNNAMYEFEMLLIISSPVGGGTPDWKGDFAEDGTFRGYLITAAAATGSLVHVVASIQQGQTWAVGTGTQAYPHIMRGGWWSGGGTIKLRWAQNTSSANVTRVHAGSQLRIRRLV